MYHHFLDNTCAVLLLESVPGKPRFHNFNRKNKIGRKMARVAK